MINMVGPFFMSGELLVCLIFLFSALFIMGFVCFRGKQMRSNLFDVLFDASDYGQILFSSKGVLIKINGYANETLSGMIDGPVEELTQSQFVDSLYDYAADFDESIRNTLIGDSDNKYVEAFKEVILSAQQEPYLVTARPVHNDYVLFKLVNINFHKKREADLIQLNLINRHLFHAMQAVTSGIIISDPTQEGNPVIFANKAFHDFVHCNEEELFSEHWQVLSSLFADVSVKQSFLDALSDFSSADISLSDHNRDGICSYNLKLTPVYNQDGELYLYVGILTDVTLLKQREAEFFHSQKLDSLGQLAAGVAHDFNNLLSIIGGYSVMISKNAENNKDILGFSQKINSAAERGAGLTRKMLTFSKHKVVSQDVLDLGATLRDQSELLKPLLAGSINLDIAVGEEQFNIKGNEDSVSQVIMNLAINARDAMPEGGALRIGLEGLSVSDVPDKIQEKLTVEECVRLYVQDSGTGMSAEILSKVFDPFFSTKEKEKGTGLGLSVVYGLVNEMSGVIDVHSELGNGTTFSVYLPRSFETVSKGLVGDLEDISSIRLNGYRALIVDDEPDLLRIVKNILEDAGADVFVASNGDEALAVCEEYSGQFDIVISDVVMPGLNGVKLAELILSLYPDLKIIFMSGYPAQGDMAPVEIPRGFPFIAKPVDYDALIHIVYGVLINKNSSSKQVAHSHWKNQQDSLHDAQKGE